MNINELRASLNGPAATISEDAERVHINAAGDVPSTTYKVSKKHLWSSSLSAPFKIRIAIWHFKLLSQNDSTDTDTEKALRQYPCGLGIKIIEWTQGVN